MPNFGCYRDYELQCGHFSGLTDVAPNRVELIVVIPPRNGVHEVREISEKEPEYVDESADVLSSPMPRQWQEHQQDGHSGEDGECCVMHGEICRILVDKSTPCSSLLYVPSNNKTKVGFTSIERAIA